MVQARAQWAARSAPAGLGVITGSVVGFDGQPVSGACVTAVGTGRSITAAAAADGAFRLAGLPAGSYALKYRDCTAGGRYLTTWLGGGTDQSTAAHVRVGAGQVRHVPVTALRPANIGAALAARRASFQRALAANDRVLAAAAAAKTGEITGTVTGKGKPLSGVCVTAVQLRGDMIYAATTGKNGRYTVRHLPPGRYQVVLASFFCPSEGNWLPQAYKNDNSLSAVFGSGGKVIAVRAGHAITGINAHLRLGGQISGAVTGKSGTKLRGICVSALGPLFYTELFVYETQTAANGSYHLHALWPGKYSLQFTIGCGSRGSNYAPANHGAGRIGLGQDKTVNETLKPGASIAGRVTLGTSSGKPLAGICVFAGNASGSVGGNAATNRDGDYRVIGLTGGSFQLQFSPGCNNNGNYTSVSRTAHTTAGKQTSGVNAVLQKGAVISGTIKNTDGKPVNGICIDVNGINSDTSDEVTDSGGSYVINQLDAGTYQVGFLGGCGNRGSYAPNWYDNQPSENTATSINVSAGETFTANAVMQPGATITGKVANTGGNTVSGVCVQAATVFDAEIEAEVGFPVSEAQTAVRHGTYTLSNLAPGQYLIDFGCGSGARYADQWFPSAPTAGAAHLVSAPAGQTSGISAVLQPAGSITGVVTGRGGHPLAGICPSAVNVKGALPPVRGTGVFVFAGIGGGSLPPITGRHGTYRISGLPAGRYRVSFSPCSGSSRYAEQWYRDKASQLQATDVTVRAGKTTPGIDGRLVLGGTISGRVTGQAGNPLRGICVLAAGQSGGPVGLAVTGKAGTYTIGDLASGRYTVEFSPCGTQNLVTAIADARVTAPHPTRRVNATMHPGGSIAGVVTAGLASGPPVSGTCVEVYSQNSAEPAGFGYTGLDGSYLATGLPAGSYQVYFGDPQCVLTTPGLAPQWYSNRLAQAAAATVTVTVGQTTGSIDAALQTDGQITGTVSGPAASPLAGACVTAFPVAAAGALPIVAVTGTSGYTLADLPPGRYKVRFSVGCGASGYATQWWKDAASQKAATVITVGPSQDISGISATLSKSG
jgi:hypothetical protein